MQAHLSVDQGSIMLFELQLDDEQTGRRMAIEKGLDLANDVIPVRLRNLNVFSVNLKKGTPMGTNIPLILR